MKKVAIMGGAYDPPRLGHALTANAVLDAFPQFEAVYWTPCGQHAFGKVMADPAERMQMIEDTIKSLNDPRHQLFAHEIVQDLTGETYLLAQSIRRNRPDLDFAFVIGMDNANFFEKWHENKKLAEEFPFIVMAREGVDPDPKVDWYRKGHHLYSDVVKPMPPVGSRDIRLLIAARKYDEAEKFLDPKVLSYIIRNDLYATKA